MRWSTRHAKFWINLKRDLYTLTSDDRTKTLTRTTKKNGRRNLVNPAIIQLEFNDAEQHAATVDDHADMSGQTCGMVLGISYTPPRHCSAYCSASAVLLLPFAPSHPRSCLPYRLHPIFPLCPIYKTTHHPLFYEQTVGSPPSCLTLTLPLPRTSNSSSIMPWITTRSTQRTT